MSIVFNQETGLFEYADSKHISSIDIKSIEVGERLKMEDKNVLKFMIRSLYEEKIRDKQRIQDLEIRLKQAKSGLDRFEKVCNNCDIVYSESDGGFDSSCFCMWFRGYHCGKCLRVAKCFYCGRVYSPKCVPKDKQNRCGYTDCIVHH